MWVLSNLPLKNFTFKKLYWAAKHENLKNTEKKNDYQKLNVTWSSTVLETIALIEDTFQVKINRF